MTKNKFSNPNKKPWPTKDAMAQVYEQNLWGGEQEQFYSGLGSHHPAVVQPYISAVQDFLKQLPEAPVVGDWGCGDFNIGRKLLPHAKYYRAIDIVPDLIAYNQKQFKQANLSFHCLDLAKDELPAADCILLRQVLQHLSNAEILAICKKLSAYKYVILTEHLPEGRFEPNRDIISGQGIRLKKGSGVDLLAPPFNLAVQEVRELLRIASPVYSGIIVTWVYTMF